MLRNKPGPFRKDAFGGSRKKRLQKFRQILLSSRTRPAAGLFGAGLRGQGRLDIESDLTEIGDKINCGKKGEIVHQSRNCLAIMKNQLRSWKNSQTLLRPPLRPLPVASLCEVR